MARRARGASEAGTHVQWRAFDGRVTEFYTLVASPRSHRAALVVDHQFT